MISLELAKKLKDAGLEWERKKGDCYINSLNNLFYYSNDFNFANSLEDSVEPVWLPSLSQLLAEIEKSGYDIMHCSNIKTTYSNLKHRIDLQEHSQLVGISENIFWGPTPEEAAGQALLWILQQRNS